MAVVKAAEGVEEEIGGPGGEETETDEETDIKKEMTHLEIVVAMVRSAFEEGRLAEEAKY